MILKINITNMTIGICNTTFVFKIIARSAKRL